jgi:hypothetical protein
VLFVVGGLYAYNVSEFCDARQSVLEEHCRSDSWEWVVFFGPVAAFGIVGIATAQADLVRRPWIAYLLAVGVAILAWYFTQDFATRGGEPF